MSSDLILYVFSIRCYSNTVKFDFVVNIFYLNMVTIFYTEPQGATSLCQSTMLCIVRKER